MHTHAHTVQCEPRGWNKTLWGPEESRWTKSRQICIRMCVQSTHMYRKTRNNDRNIIPLRWDASMISSSSRPWTGLIGSAPVQMSGCCLGGVLLWWCDGLLLALVVLRRPSVSSEEPHCAWSGTDYCVFAYRGSAAPLSSLQSFYDYRRGHYEAAQNFFRVAHSEITCSVGKLKLRLCSPWTILGYGGKRGGGVKGYWGLRKWVQWSPRIGGAKCGSSHWTEEKCGAF